MEEFWQPNKYICVPYNTIYATIKRCAITERQLKDAWTDVTNNGQSEDHIDFLSFCAFIIARKNKGIELPIIIRSIKKIWELNFDVDTRDEIINYIGSK